MDFAAARTLVPRAALTGRPILFRRLDQHLGGPSGYLAGYVGAFVPMPACFFKGLIVLRIPHIEWPAYYFCLHLGADGTAELRHKPVVEPFPELVGLQKAPVAEVRPVAPVLCA